jgi:hypothetical protein
MMMTLRYSSSLCSIIWRCRPPRFVPRLRRMDTIHQQIELEIAQSLAARPRMDLLIAATTSSVKTRQTQRLRLSVLPVIPSQPDNLATCSRSLQKPRVAHRSRRVPLTPLLLSYRYRGGNNLERSTTSPRPRKRRIGYRSMADTQRAERCLRPTWRHARSW